MNKILKYLLCYCIASFCLSVHATEGKAIQYGLTFSSYESKKEDRTSLNLTSDKPFSFSDGFILEFDVSFKKEPNNFGYIFRIVGNNDEYIDLCLDRIPNITVLEPQITAVYNSGQIICSPTFKQLKTDFDDWIKIRVMVDPKKQQFKAAIKDYTVEKTDSYFGKLQDVNIVFGKNDLVSYETSDVPSMSIKDVYIKSIDNKTMYYWKLAQHTGNGVYDEEKKQFASCLAPNWILDSHAYWSKIASFTTGIYPQIAFNRDDNQIAIIDNRTFSLYDVTNHSLETTVNAAGVPLGNKSNQLCYNPSAGVYFTYNFTAPVAVYDSLSKTWDNLVPDNDDPFYWHHNQFYSQPDSVLYTWGGYGFHIYRNDIYKYDFKGKTWSHAKFAGDTLTPRYLSGLGVLDKNTVLLFGGYGSEKGEQKLSPHNYYDLYRFDIKDHTAKRLWTLDEKQHNFVVANSLVVDSVNKCFYALCFPHQKFNTTLRLYRFSIEHPSYEILADSIPYSFSDIWSYADLYLSNDGKQLIAVTSYTDEKTNKAKVEIYTLAFPPLNKAELAQSKSEVTDTFLVIGCALIILIITALFIILWRYRKRSQRAMPAIGKSSINDNDPIVGIKPVNKKHYKQAILLFGGFQVLDKDGDNITGEFTPLLKQLFLSILLYTLKDGKGISSAKLREYLWPDKTEESAKNNRGVSLSKLREIFKNIGEISISGINSCWTIDFDKAIYCDYYEAQILIERLSVQADLKDINRLLSIISVGELLPNLQTEWVDTFKSDFSNRLIDLLLGLANNLELSPATMINIADTIFVHDSLNEDALKIKCGLLVKMGKNGLAQKVYNSFIKEYRSLYDIDYKYGFKEIISEYS